MDGEELLRHLVVLGLNTTHNEPQTQIFGESHSENMQSSKQEIRC